jgi:sec-independent protein translocase protein TatB
MAAEFRASFDEMARQSELDELRREVEALRTGQPLQAAIGLGPDAGVTEIFDDIHAGLRDGQAQRQPVASHESQFIAEGSANPGNPPEADVSRAPSSESSTTPAVRAEP